MSHTPQSALESRQEANIVQIDFSAACDSVNHLGILYKLCSVGIGDYVLSILTQCLSNRSQHVIEYDCRIELFNVASGGPQGSVFGPFLFLLYPWELFSILDNKLIGYMAFVLTTLLWLTTLLKADYTFMAFVSSPGIRVTVAESLISDLGRAVSGVTFVG